LSCYEGYRAAGRLASVRSFHRFPRHRRREIQNHRGHCHGCDSARTNDSGTPAQGSVLEEAQRLSHTGSFGWNIVDGEIFWSDETFRILEYDRTIKPTWELALQRVHPDDRSAVDARRICQIFTVRGRPSGDDSGRLEIVGAVTDITERKLAEKKLGRSEECFC
jgi:hypothetical protein